MTRGETFVIGLVMGACLGIIVTAGFFFHHMAQHDRMFHMRHTLQYPRDAEIDTSSRSNWVDGPVNDSVKRTS